MAESPPRAGASPNKDAPATRVEGQTTRPGGSGASTETPASGPLELPPLNKRKTVMGLAPAPHLGGSSPGAEARAEAEARKQRVEARMSSRPPPPRPSPSKAPPPTEEIIEPLTPTFTPQTGTPSVSAQQPKEPRFGSTTMLMVGNQAAQAQQQVAAREAAAQAAKQAAGAGPQQTVLTGPLPRTVPPPQTTARTPSQPADSAEDDGPTRQYVAPAQVHVAQVVVEASASHPSDPPRASLGAVIAQPLPLPPPQNPLDARSTLSMVKVGTGPESQYASMALRKDTAMRAAMSSAPPLGMASEAQVDRFRELRTRLLEMGQGLNLHRFTTLLVPLKSGSGGSFVARNLSVAFTMEGRGAALLVDCNLHRPSQHLSFHTPPDAAGLFAFLEDPQYGQLDRLVQPTSFPGLGLITAGRARFREYFTSQPMRGLIRTLRQTDCFVFLDGPPALGSPDARILSELADFVILVVGYGNGTPEEIAEAAATFDKNKFAGVVFNERM